MRVQFDTGSSDTWVVDRQCPTFENNRTKFDSSKSSTYKRIGVEWVIPQLADGFTGQDVVAFTGTGYSFPTQNFGQATTLMPLPVPVPAAGADSARLTASFT